MRAWEPLVGPRYAGQLFRAHVPMLVATLALALSWVAGLLQIITEASAPSWMNDLLAGVVIGSLALWPWLLNRRRNDAAGRAKRHGVLLSRQPALLTPKRFLQWCRDENISPKTARDFLS